MSERKYPLKLYFKSWLNLTVLAVSVLLNIATWIWLFSQIRPSPEGTMFFLHYNILFGVDYIGPRWQIVLIPASGTIIILLNTLLGWRFYHRDKFVSILLNSICLISQIFLLIGASLLVFLNV